MAEIDPIFHNQILTLSRRAEEKRFFTFTNFLTLSEQSAIRAMGIRSVSFWGGNDLCERKMARFGDPESMGYEEEFPLRCLSVAPRSMKFSDDLTHRDVLGAVMHLGVNRDVIGDIFLTENVGYLFCTEAMARFLPDELIKIKHTFVSCSLCEALPESFSVKVKEIRVNVASERADAVIAAIFKLSRTESARAFQAQRVFVNDAVCESGGKALRPGDRVTLRGAGKFIYRGIQAETKKGRCFVEAALYIN